MTALPPMAEMERATTLRDADYDGVFFVAVRTTRIFCRPSCPARPLPKNRVYFATAAEALAVGYRPCLRCKPLDVGGVAPVWVTRLLAAVEAAPGRRLPDKELPKAGVDSVAARRYFRANFGMTFQAYCRGRRLGEASRHIEKGATLDTAALDHGYESLSGFRDAFAKTFGRPPGAAIGPSVVVSWAESPINPLVLAATSEGLCLLEFTERTRLERQVAALRDYLCMPIVPGTNAHIERAKHELAEYFAGRRRDFTVPLCPTGTPFQRQVWDQLLRVPYGKTWSYADLARAVKQSPAACRAVGQANGRNRIAIMIPCHRVVNKDGTLGGYGGGLWRKEFLLALERKTLGE